MKIKGTLNTSLRLLDHTVIAAFSQIKSICGIVENQCLLEFLLKLFF